MDLPGDDGCGVYPLVRSVAGENHLGGKLFAGVRNCLLWSHTPVLPSLVLSSLTRHFSQPLLIIFMPREHHQFYMLSPAREIASQELLRAFSSPILSKNSKLSCLVRIAPVQTAMCEKKMGGSKHSLVSNFQCHRTPIYSSIILRV